MRIVGQKKAVDARSRMCIHFDILRDDGTCVSMTRAELRSMKGGEGVIKKFYREQEEPVVARKSPRVPEPPAQASVLPAKTKIEVVITKALPKNAKVHESVIAVDPQVQKADLAPKRAAMTVFLKENHLAALGPLYEKVKSHMYAKHLIKFKALNSNVTAFKLFMTLVSKNGSIPINEESMCWLTRMDKLEFWAKELKARYKHPKTILNRVDGLKAIYRFFKCLVGMEKKYNKVFTVSKLDAAISFVTLTAEALRPHAKIYERQRKNVADCRSRGRFVSKAEFASLIVQVQADLAEELLKLKNPKPNWFKFMKLIVFGCFVMLPTQRPQVFADILLNDVITKNGQVYLHVKHEKSCSSNQQLKSSGGRFISVTGVLADSLKEWLTYRKANQVTADTLFLTKSRQTASVRLIGGWVQTASYHYLGIRCSPMDYRHLRATHYFHSVMNDDRLTAAEKDTKLSAYALSVGQTVEVLKQYYVLHNPSHFAVLSTNAAADAEKYVLDGLRSPLDIAI